MNIGHNFRCCLRSTFHIWLPADEYRSVRNSCVCRQLGLNRIGLAPSRGIPGFWLPNGGKPSPTECVKTRKRVPFPAKYSIRCLRWAQFAHGLDNYLLAAGDTPLCPPASYALAPPLTVI